MRSAERKKKHDKHLNLFSVHDCDVLVMMLREFSPLLHITHSLCTTSLHSGYWLDVYLVASLTQTLSSTCFFFLSIVWCLHWKCIVCYVTGSKCNKHQALYIYTNMDFISTVVTMKLRTNRSDCIQMNATEQQQQQQKTLERNGNANTHDGLGKTWEVLDVDTNYVFKNNFLDRSFLYIVLSASKYWRKKTHIRELSICLNWTQKQETSNYSSMQISQYPLLPLLLVKIPWLIHNSSLVFNNISICMHPQSFLHEAFSNSHNNNRLTCTPWTKHRLWIAQVSMALLSMNRQCNQKHKEY